MAGRYIGRDGKRATARARVRCAEAESNRGSPGAEDHCVRTHQHELLSSEDYAERLVVLGSVSPCV